MGSKGKKAIARVQNTWSERKECFLIFSAFFLFCFSYIFHIRDFDVVVMLVFMLCRLFVRRSICAHTNMLQTHPRNKQMLVLSPWLAICMFDEQKETFNNFRLFTQLNRATVVSIYLLTHAIHMHTHTHSSHAYACPKLERDKIRYYLRIYFELR